MAFKYSCSVLLVVAMIAIGGAFADPQRFRSRSSRFRLARQEEAPAAAAADQPQDIAPTPVAPYPAAGVTPEVPFDLPTETEAQPDLVYGPPDNTYGPPADDTQSQPDNTYIPPADATDVAVDAPVDQNPPAASTDDIAVPQRLTQRRFRRPVPEKLRSFEMIRSRPVLVYTL